MSPSRRDYWASTTAGLLTSERPITYCGGRIAASVLTFAAALVGRPDVAVYEVSLTEWTADPERPVEIGA